MIKKTAPHKPRNRNPHRGKYTIEQLRAYAKKAHGGDCLATQYINSKTQLPWICAKGHTWAATADSVLNMRSWCPDCGGQPHVTIEDARTLARRRGGKCLSWEYTNSYTPLKWQCTEGHLFHATYSKVKGTPKKKGTWCPTCANNQRKSLADEKAYAKSRGWKCLATLYINNRTPLPYQCKKGHIWEERPDTLRKRNACPFCIKEKNSRQTKRQQ